MNEFFKLLKNNGLFRTKARLRLFSALQSNDSLTMNELISLLKKQDQATVYRNIKLFESLGIISRLRLGGKSKIELSDIFVHHHHHMTCVLCGSVIILSQLPSLENAIATLGEKQNFEITDHQLEITGYCSGCRNNNKSL